MGEIFIFFKKDKKKALLFIVVSYIFQGFVFLIPFLHFQLKTKVILCFLMYAFSHVLFWTGTIIIGANILKGPVQSLLNRLKTAWLNTRLNESEGNKE